MLKDKIQRLAHAYHQDVIGIRRHLHQNPELSYEEVETGKYISERLHEYGIPHQHGVADNGDVSNNARIIPVVLIADWTGVSGDQRITHPFLVIG